LHEDSLQNRSILSLFGCQGKVFIFRLPNPILLEYPMRRIALLLAVLGTGLVATTAHAQGVPCVAGKIVSPVSGAEYPCHGVTLLGHVLPVDMGQAIRLNDIWGWSDSESSLEVVLSGWADGVSVIDVTDPSSPKYIALIPKTAGTLGSSWRDIKVYKNYAFIVSEASGHGVQVVDLSELRGNTGARQVLLPVVTYTEVNRAHNIVINEETGFAYAVGTRGGQSCGSGLHAIDISTPTAPTFAGCVADVRAGGGYTHDAQCVVYHGPDQDHVGKEMCFASNANAISIIDVSVKSDPKYLGIGSYANSQYVHQAWLSEDHKYLFQNDELDENRGAVTNTRTLVWDVIDLDDPILAVEFLSVNTSIDHNMYVKDNLLYQSNYIDGLHVLDISDPLNISEKAFFDTYPENFGSIWDGSWSNFPYLRSGAVAIASHPQGVFIVCIDPNVCSGSAVETDEEIELPLGVELEPAYPNPFNPSTTIGFKLPEATTVRVSVSDALGREVAVLVESQLMAAGKHLVQFEGSSLPSGTYLVRLDANGIIKTRQIVLLK
jgi:choice-of-anchor B domain-containing protein